MRDSERSFVRVFPASEFTLVCVKCTIKNCWMNFIWLNNIIANGDNIQEMPSTHTPKNSISKVRLEHSKIPNYVNTIFMSSRNVGINWLSPIYKTINFFFHQESSLFRLKPHLGISVNYPDSDLDPDYSCNSVFTLHVYMLCIHIDSNYLHFQFIYAITYIQISNFTLLVIIKSPFIEMKR